MLDCTNIGTLTHKNTNRQIIGLDSVSTLEYLTFDLISLIYLFKKTKFSYRCNYIIVGICIATVSSTQLSNCNLFVST